MLFKKKSPDEFTTYEQVSRYCFKQAKEQNIPIGNFVSGISDELFNHFFNVIQTTAWETNCFGESYPKDGANEICTIFIEEKKERAMAEHSKKCAEAISAYGTKNGSTISVEKTKIHHNGLIFTRHGTDYEPYDTEGYSIYLQHHDKKFRLGEIDTQKTSGGFMDPLNININKNNEDNVKKYLKTTLNIYEITKPTDEKEILKNILIDQKQDNNFLNHCLAKFLFEECLTIQKEKVQANIKNNKIKEKIKTNIKKYRKEKNKQALPLKKTNSRE